MVESEAVRVPVALVDDAIFASLQVDPGPQVLAWLRQDLLTMAHGGRAGDALLELSGVPRMDAQMYLTLAETARMLALMGVRMVLVGIRPGIVAALAALDVDLTLARGACDMARALEQRNGRR